MCIRAKGDVCEKCSRIRIALLRALVNDHPALQDWGLYCCQVGLSYSSHTRTLKPSCVFAILKQLAQNVTIINPPPDIGRTCLIHRIFISISVLGRDESVGL